MTKIDPDAFDRLLKRRGTTKSALARATGVVRNTIRRIAKGNACHGSTLEKVARELGCSVDELHGIPPMPNEAGRRAELREVGIHRLAIHLSTQMNLNYQLVADRYGVTSDALVQAAPLCFALLAELSLKRRQDAITSLVESMPAFDKGFEHLPLVQAGLWKFDQAYDAEIASVKARDLEGKLADPDGESDSEGVFSAFIRKLMTETGIPEADDLGREAFQSLSNYRLFADHLTNITGGSRRAELALEKRHTTILQVPKELSWSPGEQENAVASRVAWLESKVPEAVWLEEEAKWASLLADLDDLMPTSDKDDRDA